jgi:hypothetical protein
MKSDSAPKIHWRSPFNLRRESWGFKGETEQPVSGIYNPDLRNIVWEEHDERISQSLDILLQQGLSRV